MGHRDRQISISIQRAIFQDAPRKLSLIGRILGFFSLFQILLVRYQAPVFENLRKETWDIEEAGYRESFRRRDGPSKGGRKKKRSTELDAVGDLGYSGSTFFTTQNQKYLIKSLPRHFEHTFFTETLFDHYIQHMAANPTSLLVRITDFLVPAHGLSLRTPRASVWESLTRRIHIPPLGAIFNTAPSHHIIMENILFGKTADPLGDKWETYDLKPADYFYPERDIAGGALAPQSIKDRLVDFFEDEIRVSEMQKMELLAILSNDTALLREAGVVDYSLFLVRYPAEAGVDRSVAGIEARESPWRVGVVSDDGKWVYRAVLLDFFWAKHKLQAKAMTGLVKSFNLFARKGPMSITTNPGEYRERFLAMVRSLVKVGTQK